MEEKTDILGLMDLMTRPVFCVKDNIIVHANAAARGMLIDTGTDVRDLIQTGAEDYAALNGGCLCLTLSLSGTVCNATVSRMEAYQVFLLDQDVEDAVFNTMALVARELRKPLDNVMQLTDQLLDTVAPENREQTTRLNRSLYQILRIVGNLSYPASGISSQEVRDVGGIVDELIEKAQTLLSGKNLRISYEGLSRSVYCLVDAQLLERAVLNLLSNAIKFTPDSGSIHISFTLRGKTLRLQITDSGSGIADQVKNDLFYRYLRQPGIEDSRFGLGLGMVMVRSCAANHGGVVLVDRAETGGSRITMTLAIRQTPANRLHAPTNLWLDYTGGRDHALVELSECLGPECYDTAP